MPDLGKLPLGEFLCLDAGSKCAVGKLTPCGATRKHRHASANKRDQYPTLRSIA